MINLIMIPNLQNNEIETNDKYDNQRNLISLNLNIQSLSLTIGIIIGWCSSFIYVLSRLPQLRLMCKTQNVTGLNVLFFILCFSGNLNQFLSMIIKYKITGIFINMSLLMPYLPWVISSGVCMCQDGLIILLIYIFSRKQNKLNLDRIENEINDYNTIKVL